MLRALEQPVTLDGIEVDVGGSLGIAVAPRHASDPAALLKCADVAMYDAKQTTRRAARVRAAARHRRPAAADPGVRAPPRARRRDVEVHLQPQARTATGESIGVEALVRWVHPEHGYIPPDEFIPIAEHSGLIGPLTTRVLDVSLAAVAAWRAQGLELGVAVNLSTRSLHDADIVDEVARLLRRHRRAGRRC